MNEIIKIIIGIFILIVGIPIGNILAKLTKEELKSGQKWFRLIIFVSLIMAIVGLILGEDFIIFGFCFIAVVTSRSLIYRKKGKK